MPELLKSFAWDFFVLFFYAQVVGLNGWMLGVAIAVIIVFDTVVDPWIGALSDRMTGARYGRRHTLMFAAILLLALLVGPTFVGGEAKRRDGRAATTGRVTGFRVGAQGADENDFVDAACHRGSCYPRRRDSTAQRPEYTRATVRPIGGGSIRW